MLLKGKLKLLIIMAMLIPEGPSVEDTSLGIDIIKDKKIKKQFIGKNLNDTIDFDLKKAFPNDTEIAGYCIRKRKRLKILKVISDLQ